MARNFQEILRLFFPEFQITDTVQERGFIATSKKRDSYARQTSQTYSQNNTEVKSAPGSSVHQMQPVSPAPSSTAAVNKNTAKTAYSPAKDDVKTLAKANEAFDGLPDTLKKYWVGSEEDRLSLCQAFQRPYVKGFDNVKPKDAILIIGPESRGKAYAVRCLCALLKQKKVFRYAEVESLDFEDYAADTENSLFLSDLYKSLNTNTEAVLFENVEKASLSQIEIIYQFLSDGTYRLPKRYMMNNGSLVEATGVLNTELVSEIACNGKIFVFTTTVSESEIVSILGNKVVRELGDIITLDPIEKDQVRDLSYTLLSDFVKKCKDNLHINILLNNNIINEVGTHYRENLGVVELKKYIEDQLYEPVTEMKLQGVLQSGVTASLVFDEVYFIALEGGKVIPVSDFLKDYNSLELEEARKELDSIIGLKKVKEFVSGLENNFKVQQIREGRGLKASEISMHMIFTGNPGTGKTTIARIVAKYLKAIGVLSSGHLLEVTRADLVGQYAGHTAVKTTDVIKSALGGVLFIDEAYSLSRMKEDPFGMEAIDALVKGMEDHRDDLVVILAGYEDEMREFLNTNPGLKSRFPNIVHFDDYSADEMYEIAKVTAASKGYSISGHCEEVLKHQFEKKQIKGRNDEGNGRLVRNMIEAAIIDQSQRIVNNPEDNMELLIPSDFGLGSIVEFDLEKSLSGIIGMEEVKNFIRSQYTMLQAEKMRRKANIGVDTTQSLNMIFAGNPGTGKTTMARIVAEMLHSMDILKSGQLVETDKNGLVSGYVGQTARKTEEVFRSALGGVLFIDEAYAITNERSGFGQECIDTLVKLIEDYRGEIVVILAGYSREMNNFMKANSGLESRFPLKIDFPDYTEKELFEIGKQMTVSRGFTMTADAEKAFEEEITRLKRQSSASSGNGRMVRNYIEEIIRRQSSRIVETGVSGEALTEITAADIKPEIMDHPDFDLEKELSKVIGLDSVKKYIRSLNARLKLQAERKKLGLKTDNTQTMHMIFAGNPGTGKTMMARTVANVLYNMNVIRSNKLIETDRSGLVAGYVGQTAIKTRQVIESALGGVLFIDEAYSLAQGGENDFGQEAIDTLVKMMDDNRDKLVVILAGYSDDMDRFLDMNPGLHSRFANIIEFPDYSIEELMRIAEGMYSAQGYVLDDEGKDVLRGLLEKARLSQEFGNGRYVRNVFERSLNNQALRLSGESNLSKESLITITGSDIREE